MVARPEKSPAIAAAAKLVSGFSSYSSMDPQHSAPDPPAPQPPVVDPVRLFPCTLSANTLAIFEHSNTIYMGAE